MTLQSNAPVITQVYHSKRGLPAENDVIEGPGRRLVDGGWGIVGV